MGGLPGDGLWGRGPAKARGQAPGSPLPPAIPKRGAMHSSTCEAMLTTLDMPGTVFLRSSSVFLFNSSSSNPTGVFGIWLKFPWNVAGPPRYNGLFNLFVCCRRCMLQACNKDTCRVRVEWHDVDYCTHLLGMTQLGENWGSEAKLGAISAARIGSIEGQ